jgi:zinc protease
LISNIREDKGYTYSPFSAVQPYRQAGILYTRADVRNEVTGPSFNEISYELNRVATTTRRMKN